MNDKMKETEIVVVLDRSESMTCISQATVDGFNSFLREQQNAEGEAYITLIQFDDRYEVNYKSLPVKEAKLLINNETYVPRGSTMLYGSIGKTINELNTDKDVIFVIITDGFDNVKSPYTKEAINKMITTLESENGWKFLFLASNQDAVLSGNSIGVKSANSMTYANTVGGVGNTFYSMSSNIGTYRSMKSKLGNITKEELNNLSENLGFSDDQRIKSI